MTTSRPALLYARSPTLRNKRNDIEITTLAEKSDPNRPYYTDSPVSDAEWYPCVAKIKSNNSAGKC